MEGGLPFGDASASRLVYFACEWLLLPAWKHTTHTEGTGTASADGTHMHYVQSSAHCNMYVSHHHVNIFKAWNSYYHIVVTMVMGDIPYSQEMYWWYFLHLEYVQYIHCTSAHAVCVAGCGVFTHSHFTLMPPLCFLLLLSSRSHLLLSLRQVVLPLREADDMYVTTTHVQ